MISRGMKMGFTGTREGMTQKQIIAFVSLLAALSPARLDSGDAIGADAQARTLADCANFGIWTVGHPPDNPRLRAFCTYDEEREPTPYTVRNRAIVDGTDYLIATPRGFTEELRSGTWQTVRYARKWHKPIVIVWPDGSRSSENWPRMSEAAERVST